VDSQYETQIMAPSEANISQSMAPFEPLQQFSRLLELPKEIQIVIWEAVAAAEPQLIRLSNGRLANGKSTLVKTTLESPLLNTC
jgi:hypothetical protein